MGIVTNVIDALRRFGSPTQKTAIERQDKQLQGKQVIERRREVSRSELGHTPTSTFRCKMRHGASGKPRMEPDHPKR